MQGMHRVAFDIRTRLLTGIYRYGSSILEHLIGLLPGTDIRLYLLYRPDTQEQVIRKLSRSLPRDRVELIAVSDDQGRIPRSPWIRNWAIREGIELYYSIDFVVDRDLPVPFVYTVHDLLLYKYPEVFYSDDETFRVKFGRDEFTRMEHDLQQIKSYIPTSYTSPDSVPSITKYILAMSHLLAERSRHIITSSQSSKEDIVQLLSVPASKVTVIPAAADASCFYPRPREEEISVVRKYGLTQNYCLGVGLDLKHKRLSWLLGVLAHCRGHLPGDARVVIVGKYEGLDRRLEEVASLGLDQLVVFTGRVSDDELACLYSGARALIVPSIDEGFGLPTVEALLCGTEVMVPDTRVLREVAGPCGHYFGVDDRDLLGDLITQALTGFLAHEASSFVNRFSWDVSARQFLGLLKSVLEGERTDVPSAF